MNRLQEQYNKAIRSEALSISSSLPELVNLAVAICYELYPSDRKSFLWSVFGDGVIDNIKNNILNSGIKTIKVPFISLGSELNNENIKLLLHKLHLPYQFCAFEREGIRRKNNKKEI